ncbi:MAG TPA: transcriptional repressor, partial [Pelobium sp.]|nr:transcriptional repressor [Pelobium sp.]
ALCSTLCTDHKHQDDHVHFNCTNCLNVYCLDSLSIPAINLPNGYLSHSITLMVYGLCEKCNQTALS